MLKHFWLLTILIFIFTGIGTHTLVAFTQTLPPYYNCIRLRDVQVSLNRHLSYRAGASFRTISESPDGQWRIRREYDDTASLENIKNGREIPLEYDLDHSSPVYWSPDSRVFSLVLYYMETSSQPSGNSFNVLFVSTNGNELVNQRLEASSYPLVIGWSNTSRHFAMRTFNSNGPQYDWIFTAPNFNMQQFDLIFDEGIETDYRTKAAAWSHADGHLATLVGNSLVLTDPAQSMITLTHVSASTDSSSLGFRYNFIRWSPNDRYIAIMSHDSEASGDPDENLLYVIDTHDDTLKAVSSLIYRVHLGDYPPINAMLFWGSESTVYFLETPNSTDSSTNTFQLSKLDVETGINTLIYPQVLDYQFDREDIRIRRVEGDQQFIERFVNGLWLEIFSAPSRSVIEVKFLPTSTFIHQDENGWYRTHLISNDGLQRYVSPPNVASYLHSWDEYILISITDAPYVRFEIVDEETFKVYRPPESWVAEFNEDSLIPHTGFFVSLSPNGLTMFVSFYGNGMTVSTDKNNWQILYLGQKYTYPQWSPDSKRIVVEEHLPFRNRHLLVYDADNGQEWDLGFFPGDLFRDGIGFDKCGDIISILRGS